MLEPEHFRQSEQFSIKPHWMAKTAIALSFIALFSFIVISAIEINKINVMRHDIARLYATSDSLASRLSNIELQDFLQNMEGIVDLSESVVQPIGNGFLAVKLEANEHLTGLKISGRIINTQCVAHETVKFKLQIAGQSKEFTISRISPGNSTAFSVYIPDVAIGESRVAKISYIESMIRYLAD